MQDLGAAGLTSASVESASRSGRGMEIDVSRVPRRDAGMSPYEVMLSESQERMLIAVKPGHEEQAREIFSRWDLESTVIGRVTDDGLSRIFEGKRQEAELPIDSLVDPPLYRLKGTKPEWLGPLQDLDLSRVPLPKEPPGEVFLKILASPNISSKESVYRRYDHQVQTGTVVAPGGDAAVLRIRGTSKGIALSTDGNSRYCFLEPYVGGMIAVAEACRNVSCVGGEPAALTDCLNFGNPERTDVYYQLEECIKGIASASRALDAPVISGNVSVYNETQGEAIHPTPIIGALGVLDDVSAHVSSGFMDDGDLVVLLGAAEVAADPATLAGSEYLEVVHELVAGRPSIALELEAAVQKACRRAIREGVIKSAHDCSDGGLAVALAESCIPGGVGFQGSFSTSGRWDAALFGEAQSRIVVSLGQSELVSLADICEAEGVPTVKLGLARGDRFSLEGLLDLPLADIESAWRGGGGLDRALGRL